jgi:hypothetical protein
MSYKRYYGKIGMQPFKPMAEQAQQRHDIEHTVDPTTDLDDLDRWEGRYYQLVSRNNSKFASR